MGYITLRPRCMEFCCSEEDEVELLDSLCRCSCLYLDVGGCRSLGVGKQSRSWHMRGRLMDARPRFSDTVHYFSVREILIVDCSL